MKRNKSRNKSGSRERSRGKKESKGAVPERQPLVNTLMEQQSYYNTINVDFRVPPQDVANEANLSLD